MFRRIIACAGGCLDLYIACAGGYLINIPSDYKSWMRILYVDQLCASKQLCNAGMCVNSILYYILAVYDIRVVDLAPYLQATNDGQPG